MTSPFSHDAFDDRRASYEASYFHGKDAALVAKLKGVFNAKISKEEIRKQTGISDDAALDRLVNVVERKELLSAFKLYPLVEIAWADGEVDEQEIHAIEAAAEKAGVLRGSAAFERMASWIRSGPTDNARTVWRLYAAQLRKTLTKQELDTFREDLLKFAKSVADASGNFFGIFGNTSSGESLVIKEITKALTPE